MATPRTKAQPTRPAAPDATPKPAGTLNIDLDAAAHARREERGVPAIEVTFKGRAFRLPAEMPLDAVEPLADLADLPELTDEQQDGAEGAAQMRTITARFELGLATLFCDEDPAPEADADGTVTHGDGCQWRVFKRSRPTLEDLMALWSGLFAAYGTTMGEALASLRSAGSDGAPSPATSGGTTRSTRARSGAAKGKAKRKR